MVILFRGFYRIALITWVEENCLSTAAVSFPMMFTPMGLDAGIAIATIALIARYLWNFWPIAFCGRWMMDCNGGLSRMRPPAIYTIVLASGENS